MENVWLSSNSKRKFAPGPFLLIAAGLATLALLAAYLLNMAGAQLELPTDPPPIIIKSGSFIMEGERVFQPDLADQRSYKYPLFNGIKGIRVVAYSENPQLPTSDRKFFEGKDGTWVRGDSIQVNIYIQICQQVDLYGLCISWSGLKKVEVFNSNTDLAVNVPAELHLSKNKRNKKNKRQNKNEDENTEIIRFNLVEIINRTRNTQLGSFSALDGQEFYIGFYNALAN